MNQNTSVLLSKKKRTRDQVFNVQVSEEENIRLQKLATRVYPSNKAEAFRLAVRVLESLAHELDNESELYIKRKGDEEPVKYDELLSEE